MMAKLGAGSDPRKSSLELLGREAACVGVSKWAAPNPEIGVAVSYHSVTAWKQASMEPHPEYPPRPWVLSHTFQGVNLKAPSHLSSANASLTWPSFWCSRLRAPWTAPTFLSWFSHVPVWSQACGHRWEQPQSYWFYKSLQVREYTLLIFQLVVLIWAHMIQVLF